MPIFYALSQLLNNPYLAEFEIQMKHIIKRQVQHTFDFKDFNPFEEPNPKILTFHIHLNNISKFFLIKSKSNFLIFISFKNLFISRLCFFKIQQLFLDQYNLF